MTTWTSDTAMPNRHAQAHSHECGTPDLEREKKRKEEGKDERWIRVYRGLHMSAQPIDASIRRTPVNGSGRLHAAGQ
jgi:hypothetical protein